jgi:hypothetical protein
MDLIERYVHEVGRHLPRKQRVDVETELRSLLQDMVEDRAQTKVEKADEETIVAVLKEFGRPEKVAASYQTRPHYLIGPELFPIFQLVLTISLVGFVAITVFGVVLSARNSDAFLADVTRALAQAIPDVVGGLFSAFGSIVLVFAILERVLPNEEFAEEEEEAWDPRKLPAVNPSQEINRGETVAGIVFGIILLLLLNVFPQWAGVFVMHDGQFATVPLLSANFYANLLPWVNLLLLVSIGVDIYKVRLGRHNRVSRMLDIGVALWTAVTIYILIVQGPIFGVNSALAETTSFPQEGTAVIARIFNMIENIGLPILLVLELFSAAKNAYQLWQMPKMERPQSFVEKAT